MPREYTVLDPFLIVPGSDRAVLVRPLQLALVGQEDLRTVFYWPSFVSKTAPDTRRSSSVFTRAVYLPIPLMPLKKMCLVESTTKSAFVI